MKSLEFRIRKLHTNSEPEKRLAKRQASRVHVSEEALLELTGSKDGGRLITIEKISSDNSSLPREATLWRAPEKLDKSVTQLYDVFRDVCGFKLGETVRITAIGSTPLPDAESIVVEDTSSKDAVSQALSADEVSHWQYSLGLWFNKNAEHIYPGMNFKNVVNGDSDRTFTVTSVNGRSNANARYKHKTSKVSISQNTADGQTDNPVQGKLEVVDVRGLDAQIKAINSYLNEYNGLLRYPGLPDPRGLIIHGGMGTGKTMLLNRIARSAGESRTHRLHFKDKLSDIQDTLERARAQQPSVVLIDQLDKMIDKERNNRAAVILALCDAFDALARDAERSGEMPRVAIIATCSDFVTQIPQELQDPGRFEADVYLPLPDVDTRREILKSFDPALEADDGRELLDYLSERTHAYTGKDLKRLFNEACHIATARIASSVPAPTEATNNTTTVSTEPADATATIIEILTKTRADWSQSLTKIRPSAMHDINLKPPPIHWTDIGGQDTVKSALRTAVALSTEPRALLDALMIPPPKGFLLYGPPGCSKTMAAQAMATESGLNFFAVKGAELLNMYVGESERAVRRLFARAREVAPSMIFFDEIDSIAGQRSGFSNGGASSGGGGGGGTTSHGGLNVLTTLLNEMDGFETLQGVIVLAATNRPQALDPALLRPGRFDELIYVSPPDEAARRAILQRAAARGSWAADVDVEELVGATDGYSGAEIKGICTAAGKAVYRRFREGGEGKTLATTAAAGELSVTRDDLMGAVERQRRQITKEMLEGYAAWERQFRKY